MFHSIKRVGTAVAAVLTAFCFSITSCAASGEEAPQRASLSFRNSEGLKKGGQVLVEVRSNTSWKLSIRFTGEGQSEATQWATLTSLSSPAVSDVVELRAEGNKKNIFLSYSPNPSDEERMLELVLETSRLSTSEYFTQSGKSGSSAQEGDKVRVWMELPEVKDGDGLTFHTHMMYRGSKYTRNYSYYWDREALVSRWVAYPLCPWDISGSGRTDKWGYDPKIPEEDQPRYSGGISGYDRGHQLPSADRPQSNMYAANVATFYYTNMTPQLGSLNQKIWQKLEDRVRTWTRCFDTLYVVTGCCVEGSTRVASDNDGKAVKVPTHYYKALLGYERSLNSYKGIGFLFEHRGYSDNSKAAVMNQAVTIDRLEEFTGVNFFVNLPQPLQDAVESASDFTGWANDFVQ